MSASSSDIVLTGPRLSSAVRCPRMAVYQGVGVEGREPTLEEQRRFRRGHALADVAKQQIAEDLAAQGRSVEFEVEIPWGGVGVGHADVDIPDDDTIVEITTTKDCDLPEHKPVQAAAYAIEHGRAGAVVLSIDPSTGEEQAYPINVDAFRDRWAAIKQQVIDGVRDGVLPDRVCRHPNDGPARFCPFSGLDGHCFQGWVPTVEHPDAPTAFQELADLEDQLRDAPPSLADELKARREDVRAEVLAYVDAGVESVAGGVSVRVTEVAEGEGFSLAAMRKAGFDLPDQLHAFITRRSQHTRWTVRRVQEQP